MKRLTYNDIPANSPTYEIPSDVEEIWNECFKNCKNTLKNFTFQQNPALRYIGELAFYQCKLLESIDLSQCNNLINISRSAFSSCSNVLILKLPNGLENIETSAFAEIDKLATVSLPSSLKYLGDFSFNRCKMLSVLEIKKDSMLNQIGRSAIGNAKIEFMYLPKNLSLIEGQGISVNLSLDPENSYLYADDHILYGNNNRTICWCYNYTITELILGDEIDIIAADAFRNCNSLMRINATKIVAIMGSAFGFCGSLISVNISSINEIHGYAFYFCTGLKYFSVSNLTKSDSFCTACSKLLSISDFHTQNFQAYNNMLIDLIKNELILYAVANPATEIEINCSIIGVNALSGAKNLRKIILKNTTKIVYGGLNFCSNLKTIYFPKTLKSIDDKIDGSSYRLRCVIVEDNDETVKRKLIAAGIPEKPFNTCPRAETYIHKGYKHHMNLFDALLFPLFKAKFIFYIYQLQNQ